MSTAHPRPGAYIWATWLAPLLAGANACIWSAWFKAHFAYHNVSRFDGSTWQVNHNAMVLAAREALGADDFEVTEEDENKFALANGGITLAGKPDLVAVRPDHVLVVDCKSGAPWPAHRAQVMLYMTVLPYVRHDLKGQSVEGLIQYRDEAIMIPAAAINDEFRRALRTLIHTVGGPTPPPRAPSARECRFCPIGSEDCPDRVELVQVATVSGHSLF